jgi:hypothetical protein
MWRIEEQKKSSEISGGDTHGDKDQIIWSCDRIETVANTSIQVDEKGRQERNFNK